MLNVRIMVHQRARISLIALLLAAPGAARADPLALRLPTAGTVVAIGWGDLAAGYWQAPGLGFAVDGHLPGQLGLYIGTRAHTGKGMGLDFGIAGGPEVTLAGPSLKDGLPAFDLMIAPWCDFALRGRGVFDVGFTLPGTAGLSVFGATWSAPLLLEASGGWTFGTVRIGLWGNVGGTYAVSDWIPEGNGGLWLGVARENRTR